MKALSHSAEDARGRQVAFWVAAAVLISSIDRGNLATAAPLIRAELHLTETQLGVLISCFFWSYTLAIGGATWLAGQFGPHRVLAGCVLVWSIATGCTGLAAGFAGLFALRLLLGVGESGVSPCASAILVSDAQGSERGRANGLMGVAYAIGPAFGTLAGGLLMSRVGWRWVFAGLGVMSITWLWPWLRLQSRRVATRVALDEAIVPLRAILRERAMWGTLVGNVCGGYTYYFVISWMPTYLVQERGFSMSGMAELIAATYIVRAATSLLSGRLIDRWTRAGRPTTALYKWMLGGNQAAAVACLTGMALAGLGAFVGWMFIYEFFAGLSTTAGLALVQTFAGPRATGPWVGAVNVASSAAGMVAPAVTGLIVDRTGHFTAAFGLAGAVALVGFIAWVFVVPRAEPCNWPQAAIAVGR